MRRRSFLPLVLIFFFILSLANTSGYDGITGISPTNTGISDLGLLADSATPYTGTGAALTVSFTGTFTNSSTWTQTSTTLSAEFTSGTSFSVTNASSVAWTAYVLVSPPPGIASLSFAVGFPGTEWRPNLLTNPVGVVMSYPSQWWYDANTVFVSTSAVTTYGVWKLQFLGLNQLTNLQLGKSSGPFSSTATFDTTDEMLFRTTSTWIAGSTTEYVLTDPTGSEWYSTTNTTSGVTSHLLQSFAYRKDITVDRSRHLSYDLTNFPLLIDIYDTDLHTKVQADGDDIVFYEGGKMVPHEIELFNQSYNPTQAHLIAWVKVNLTGSVNTVISMYYGNPVIGPQERPEAVWTQSFSAVWHLNEDATAGGTSTIHYDSTAGNRDGTQNGNEDDVGKIGVSQRFDGSNDQVVISSSKVLNPSGDVEISGWFKLDTNFGSSSPTTRLIFEKYLDGDNDMHVALAGTDYSGSVPAGSLVFKVENDGAGQKYKWTTSTSWTAGVWYYFSCTMDAGTPQNNKVYVNAEDKTSGTSTGSLTTAHLTYSGSWGIGGGLIDNVAGYYAWFDGVIDDVRVSNTIRSAAWRSGSYSNQYNPSNFYLVGSEQQRVSPELTMKKIADGTAIAGVWKISALYNDSGSSVSYRVGMYERTFTILRSSSLTISAPTAAIGNGVVLLVIGDILYTEVNLVDSLTGGITGATVAMNWTLSGVGSLVYLSDMGSGVYGIAVNTSDLVTNVRWRINLIATDPYHRSSSTYFYLDLYHETSLDYSDLTTTPVGFDSNVTLTFYDDFDGSRITGATLKFANGTSLTVLSQTNGVYHVSFDTSSLAQGKYSYIINATKLGSLYKMATANITFTIRPHYTALSVSGNLVTPFGYDTSLTVQLIDIDTGTPVNIGAVTSLSFTSSYGTQVRATYSVTLTTNAWTVALTDVTLSATMSSSTYYTPNPYDFQINIRKHYTAISVTGGLVSPYGNVTPLTIAITDLDTGTLLSASSVQSFTFTSSYAPYTENDPIADLYVNLPTGAWAVGSHAVTLQLTMKAASNYFSPSNYGFSLTIRSLTTVLYNRPNDLVFPNGDDLVVQLQFNVSEPGPYYGDPINGVIDSAFYVNNATFVYPKSVVGLGNGIYQLTISATYFPEGTFSITITVSPSNPNYARTQMILNFEYRKARSDLTSNLYTVSTPYSHNVTVILSYVDLDRAIGIVSGVITSPDTWISYVHTGGGSYSVVIGVYTLNVGTHQINLTAQASGYDTRTVIITVIVTRIHTDAQPSVISLDMPVGNTKIFYIDFTDLDNSVPIGNSSFAPTDDWAGSVSISYIWTGTRYEVTFTTTGSDTLGLFTITFTFSPGANYFDAACAIEVDVRTHITIFNLVSAVEPTPFNGIVNMSLRYYDWDNKVGITDDTNIQVLLWNQTNWIATSLINVGSGYYILQIDASLFGQGLQYFDIYFNWIGPVQQYENKSTTASVNIIGIDSQIALLSASEPTAYLGVMSYTFFYSELSGLGITNSSYGGGHVLISISFEGASADLSQVTISEIDPILQPGKYSISFNTTIFGKTGLIYMNVYINWSAGVAPFYTNRADVISVRVLARDTLLAVIPPSPTAYGENATFTFSFDDVTGGSNVPIDNNPALSVLLSLGSYSISYNSTSHLFTVSFNTSQFGAPLGQKSFTLGVNWGGAPFYANRTGRVIFMTVTARQTTLDFQSPAPTSFLDNVTLAIDWVDVTGVPSTGISGATIQLYDVTGATYIPGAYYTIYWISGGQYEISFNTSYYISPATYSLRVYLSTPDFYIPDVSSTRSFNVRYRLTLLSAEPIGLVPYNSSLVYTLDFQDLDTLETIPSPGGEVTIVVLDSGWTYNVVWNPSFQTYTLTIETYDHTLNLHQQYSLHIQASYASQSPFYGSDDAYITFELRSRQSDLVIDDPPDPTAYLENAIFRVYYFDVDSSTGITANSIIVLKGITPLIQGIDYILTYQGNGYYLLTVNSSKLDGLGLTTLNVQATWNPGLAPYHDNADIDVSIYVTKREANVEITVPPTQTKFLDNIVFSFVYRDLRSGSAIGIITSANVAIWAGGVLLTPVVQYSISQVGSSFTVYINSTIISATLVSNYNVTVRVDWNDVSPPFYYDDSTLVRVTTTNRRMSYAVLAAEEAAYGELLNLSFSITDADSGRAVVLMPGNILFDGKIVSLTEGVDFWIDFSESPLGRYTITIDTVSVGLPSSYLFNLYVNWNPASQPFYLSLTPINPIEMTGVISKIDTLLLHMGPDPETAIWGEEPAIIVNYTNLVFGNLTTDATVTWAWPAAGVEFGSTGDALGNGVYTANINTSLADAGTYIITFRATGLAAYKDAFVYVTLVVRAVDSEIIPINPTDPVVLINRGAALLITIKLQDGASNPILNVYVYPNQVKATIDGVSFVFSYNGTPGYYTLTLPENDETATKKAPGSYTIIITASMRNYEPAAFSFKIQVLQTSTTVLLTGGTSTDISKTYTENVTVYVQLVLPDLGNAPFWNATVEWIVVDTSIRGNFTPIGPLEDGNYTATISTAVIGFGSWNIIFRATPWENASLFAASQTTISFGVKRIQTSSIPPATRDFYWGWTGYLNFQYWDETFGVGIAGANVSIELPGLKSEVLYIGNGTYQVFFNTSLLIAGSYYIPLPVSFSKSNYVPSSSIINIRVLPVPTDIYVAAIEYTPTYVGELENYGNNQTISLLIPFGDSMAINFFYNDTDDSEGFLGGLPGAMATFNSYLRGPSIESYLNVTINHLGGGLYQFIFDTMDPTLAALVSSESYRLYIEMSLGNRSSTDILFRIEVINVQTTLAIVNPPSEWTLINGDFFEIELYYFDTWHGIGITGASISANASAGAPFDANIYEGATSGHYFVSISSRGIMLTPASGTVTIGIDKQFYELGSQLLVLNVIQNPVDSWMTTGIVYGLPISIFIVLLLGAYVKVWSVPKRIRQINGQIKMIRKGKIPKPIADAESRQDLIAVLFNDTFATTGIIRTSDQMPEESIPVEVPELGELLVQLAILTNLNAQELDDFKADISKMKMSEQAAFVKEVIMQEAIRAARRDNKSIELVIADVQAQAARRVAGDAEAAREEEDAEEAEPEVERVILPSEREPIIPRPRARFEEPEPPKEGDIEASSDLLSPYEIEELKKNLEGRGIPLYEIDTILKQAKELPRDLVEELIRSLEKKRDKTS